MIKKPHKYLDIIFTQEPRIHLSNFVKLLLAIYFFLKTFWKMLYIPPCIFLIDYCWSIENEFYSYFVHIYQF